MSRPPRPLSSRARRLAAAVVAGVLAVLVLTPTAATAAGGAAGDVFARTNAQRTAAGLPALVSDPGLDAAAAEWARQLASSCTFEHSSSSWRSTRIAAFGWTASGENIAAGQPDAAAVVSSWMASPGHKANILDRRYTGLGVGHATGSCYRTYWVQIFGVGSPVRTLPGGAGDLNGDRSADLLARTASGDLRLYPGPGTARFGATSTVIPGWGSRPFTPLGDFTGDKVPDIARTEADGRLMLFAGNGRGGLGAPVAIGSGWSRFSQLIGGMDFDGDRLADVIARTPAGELLLYRGNGRGGWLSGGTRIGSGWQTFTAVFSAGDFTGDSRSDLIGRRSDGTLWLYATTGKGSWATGRQIGKGWGSFTALAGAGDFDGNGTQDIFATNASGALLLYGGTGRGGFLPPRTVGSGWNGIAQLG
ncbi:MULTISPECIES: FG-GAP-like repeat-containing protein [Microbacterium]|uniref:FG-GAP-like repeat-containing protein n=1 Tax=Microbacterium TaxID=33882 RepID=UPI0011EB49AA|nr:MULTISPECIES: FG-GAP-like repeat-containing protein [Microbacterium]